MAAPSEAIERLRERAETSADLVEADRDVLIRFSDELFVRSVNYSDHRHEKLLRHCVRIAEETDGLAAVLEDEAAAKRVVTWINRTYDNEETNRDYRVALRVFAKHVTDGEDVPESVAWVSGQTSRNYDPKPDPREMLHWEEHVLPMIETCHNNRDKAMLAVAWDAGTRSGEFRDLQVRDVTDHTHGLQITVDGKTGQRSVTLIPSVPFLQRWLADHPGDESSDLWSKLHQDDDLSYNAVKKVFVSAAERAGVTRPVTLTNFRKSSASHLASQGMNQAHIEDHHGWTRGSTVAARYVAVFSGDSDRELAKVHGLDVEEDEPDPIAPVACPRCDRDNPHDVDACVWCGQALEAGAVERIRREEREVRRDTLKLAKENPELLEDVDTRQEIIGMLEDNPELLQHAKRFADALEAED
ncbi:tyrosine-type recombinase/integrase [Halomarina rubra]|uniref:Tyrosine-type recombinase/integrase n=1 Tax=Halomarina rubra TaxID=2071873 RepID=A0ABD6ASI5_9EURY|nr:tyrosine-type recombinase/integrase [Halomarina rubra]